MLRQTVAWPLCLAGIALCATVAAWISHAAGGQDESDSGRTNASADAGDDPIPEEIREPDFAGALSCAGCHQSSGAYPNELALFDESKIWNQHDKHSEAVKNLSSPLGQRIETALQANLADWKDKKVAEDRRCLSCHANWIEGRKKPPPNELAMGVTCESCHGPSTEWNLPHQGEFGPKADVPWRLRTPQFKTHYGFVDVRNPIDRATQCFSCHVGDAKQGKVVTHEMYAAGHPPLPGFEVESFARRMPKHWRYLREKGNFPQRGTFPDEAGIPAELPPLDLRTYLHANFRGYDHDPAKDLPRTKAVILGGVVALRESVQLLADLAGTVPRNSIELAAFHCSACHHDLKVTDPEKGPRQFGSSRPGRPPMQLWPVVLVKLAVRKDADDQEKEFAAELAAFDDKLAVLRDAISVQPFGDPDAIATAAQALNKWLNDLASRLDRAVFDEAAARTAINTLLDSPESDYVDYHSARQIAWALKAILSELHSPYPKSGGEEGFMSAADGEDLNARKARGVHDETVYRTWLDQRDKSDQIKKIEAELRLLDEQLHLNLPVGKAYSVETETSKTLSKSASYDPAAFGAELKRLAEEFRFD